MDPQPTENFFELTLSQEGEARIMRLVRIVKWLFIFSIVFGLLIVVAYFLRMELDRRFPETDRFLKIETAIRPYYTVVIVALLLTQMYYYFHFTRLCKKAIELRQADVFNYAFKWLIRSAMISMTTLVIEIVMGIFSIYVLNHLLQKYPAQ